MKNDGHLTGWTCLLLLAGLGLGAAGGILAPATLPTWLLIGGWLAIFAAANNIYRPIRRWMQERDIRADERARLAGRDGRQP